MSTNPTRRLTKDEQQNASKARKLETALNHLTNRNKRCQRAARKGFGVRKPGEINNWRAD